MRKADVQIGGRYTAKVSEKLVVVRIRAAHPLGGWIAVNEKTGREVRIHTAARLRDPVLSREDLAKARAAGTAPSLGVNFLFGGGWRPSRRGARFLFSSRYRPAR